MVNNKKNTFLYYFQLLPIIIFTAVVIVLMRVHIFNDYEGKYFWLNVRSSTMEVYNFAKLSGIIVSTVLAAINLLYDFCTNRIRIKKLPQYYIPMAIFAALIILSYIFSDYKDYALWGWRDLYEGTIAWLCYIFMLFYTINYINSEKAVKIVVFWVIAFITFINILGLFQSLGINFLTSNIIKKLVVPASLQSKLSISLATIGGTASQTLYNINYVSFYLAMLIPFVGILFFYEEKVFIKTVLGIIFALLVANIYGSHSSGGFLGIFAAILAALALLNKKLVFWWKSITLLILITCCITFLALPNILSELSSIKNVSSNYIYDTANLEEQPNDTESLSNSRIKLDYIETLEDRINVSIYGNSLSVKYYDGRFACYDSSGDELALNPVPQLINNEVVYHFLDKRFAPYIGLKTLNYSNVIALNTPGYTWNFIFLDKFYYINIYGHLISLTKTPSLGFKNSQKFGTDRGYVWSRTFPLLKDTIFLGHGANTFALYFPQNDYVGKYNIALDFNVIYEKPHCLYLVVAMNSGLISLVAFLMILFVYIFDSIKIYSRLVNKDSYMMFVGTGLFLGICGFLVSALVNDSNLSVMPIFFGFLGMGIGCNDSMRDTKITPK